MKLVVDECDTKNGKLLLARGACIETYLRAQINEKNKSCSSQEEHVLKLREMPERTKKRCCSSQEEHVLKQGLSGYSFQILCCSSQEEHVLKLLRIAGRRYGTRGCSSQEEHVLKQ